MNLNSPTLSPTPLSARQEQAVSRGVDGVLSMMEWAPPERKPASAGFFVTRPELKASAVSTRVLFTGNFWMTDKPVAAWRSLSLSSPLEKPFRPVSTLVKKGLELAEQGSNTSIKPVKATNAMGAGELVQTRVATQNAPKKAFSFEDLALEPIEGDLNPELASVKKLAELEMRVEVIRFLKPAAKSTGVSSGRVLAVSENFSAQQVGAQDIVVHNNVALDRIVAPGELVTLHYDESGKANVYEGLLHDINIDAPWMAKDQNNYMRMVMMDALSMINAPMSDDDRLRAAMQYALESTVNFFGLEESRLRLAEIELTINEVVGPSFASMDSKGDMATAPAPGPRPRM